MKLSQVVVVFPIIVHNYQSWVLSLYCLPFLLHLLHITSALLPAKVHLLEGSQTIYPTMILMQAPLSDCHLLSFPLPCLNNLVEARLQKNKATLKSLLTGPQITNTVTSSLGVTSQVHCLLYPDWVPWSVSPALTVPTTP